MSHPAGAVLKRLVRLPRNPEGCWTWLGHTNDKGVPTKQFNGKPIAARRWLWEQLFGPVPPGLNVYCTCGTLTCISPHHMRAGTDFDRNLQNMSNLTPGDVEEIRRVRHAGIYERTAVAMKLGIDPEAMRSFWRPKRTRRRVPRQEAAL